MILMIKPEEVFVVPFNSGMVGIDVTQPTPKWWGWGHRR